MPFVALLEEATNEGLLQALQDQSFTHVYLQCSAAHDQIEARLKGDARFFFLFLYGNGLQQRRDSNCNALLSPHHTLVHGASFQGLPRSKWPLLARYYEAT